MAEGWDFDQDEYDLYIRRGAEDYIERDERLLHVLESLPQRKVLFTNSPERSALKCLDLLGLEGVFEVRSPMSRQEGACDLSRSEGFAMAERRAPSSSLGAPLCFAHRRSCAGRASRRMRGERGRSRRHWR